ncbi:unnamed protein product, partial [Scytosiphon promiscuus]
GPIPKELGALSKLEQLYLRRNGFTGHIPLEVGYLFSFFPAEFVFSRPLAGVIPAQLGQLSALEHLGLSENEL